MHPSVLTIAGSDPSGGAGIQADLKTFTALECYGTSVLAALTAQNTLGVQGIHECPPEFVEQQLRSVLEDIPILSIKTGMLASGPIIEATVKVLEEIPVQNRPKLVVDPVMVSSSGHRLLESSATSIMQKRLLPLATILTPNIHEAAILLESIGQPRELKSIADMKTAAQTISDLAGTPNVLVKGGHLLFSSSDINSFAVGPNTIIEYEGVCDPQYPAVLASTLGRDSVSSDRLVVDVLFTQNEPASSKYGSFTCFVRPQLNTTSTHGTGCTLSAAIASELAKGRSVLEATRLAIAFTFRAIATAEPIGKGHGPLNHQHSIVQRGIPMPTPASPHPFISSMIASSRNAWDSYVKHDFVYQLGCGTLPVASFKHFITQDYIYLKYYARAHGLLALKSPSYTDISASALIMEHIVRESKLHETYCATWDIEPAALAMTEEATMTTAYGAFIIDTGLKGDALDLLVALGACLLGYGEVGLWLKKEALKEGSPIMFEGNPYRKWMEDYSGPHYQEACRTGIHLLEARIAADPPSAAKVKELTNIWARCVQLERGFWDMAMTLSK